MGEQWKDISGYEGRYQVSDCGRVRSLRFRNRFRDSARIRVLRLGLRQDGRRNVSLIGRTFLVHRLVLAAFRGSCPVGLAASHLNGNPGDNRLSNLVWETLAANNARKYAHGTDLRGANSNSAKLSMFQVRVIRRLVGAVPVREMASLFAVSRYTIYDIVRGRTWAHA